MPSDTSVLHPGELAGGGEGGWPSLSSPKQESEWLYLRDQEFQGPIASFLLCELDTHSYLVPVLGAYSMRTTEWVTTRH